MPIEVTMPQMGESVVEGTVTKWLVKEGDEVHSGDILAEIDNLDREAVFLLDDPRGVK